MWPEDGMVQIVLIISVAVVLVLAIWLGRGLRFRKGDKGIEFTVEQKAEKSGHDINVADGVEVRNAKINTVAGVDGATAVTGQVNVANNAKLEGVEINELVGVKMK